MQSQFLFNDSRVQWGSVEGIMFAQIQVLQRFGNYYHLWAGFEDGSFLGYYNKGVDKRSLDPYRYTISWQSNENHSCPEYNYTMSGAGGWNQTIGRYTAESGVPYSKPPPEVEHYVRPLNQRKQELPLRRFCREFFMADSNSGKRKGSFHGAVYDCRKRAWYYNTKKKLTQRWISIDVDRGVGEPFMANCAPLANLTARATIKQELRDEATGLVGVACVGVYIEDLSTHLLEVLPSFDERGVYVRERSYTYTDVVNGAIKVASSGKLVATSSPLVGAYWDGALQMRFRPTESPDALVAWSAEQLLDHAGCGWQRGVNPEDGLCWPDDGTTLVKWVNASRAAPAGLTSIAAGDAYYIQVSIEASLFSGVWATVA